MRIVLTILIMAMLAGCADDAPAEPTQTGPATQDLQTKSDVGAISGVVVDGAIVTLPDVTVVLMGQGISTITNAEGQFVFEDLAPGTYFLSASGVGYTDAQTSVDVVDGAVAKPRMQMQADMTPQPYKETLDFRGHMVFSDFVAVYVLTDIIGDNDLCQCSFELTSEPGVETMVVDTVWKSSYTRVEEHDMYWDVFGGDGRDSKWIQSEEAWHVAGAGFGADTTEWRFLISSGEQPDVEQEFEGYITFWYVQKAPSGWTFLDESA
jgi:hypothetical protein